MSIFKKTPQHTMNINKTQNDSNVVKQMTAWGVHLFTALGAIFGILTLYALYHHEFHQALWYMAATVFIDAIDGTLARRANVKAVLPNFDGALLDNIIDFLNYVVTPCFFFIVKPDFLPTSLGIGIVTIVSLTSAYQFCQSDAKTPDHFFKGFPCYWNIVLFYLLAFNTPAMINAIILITLSVLIFVPIKYVYPSRIDYLTHNVMLKRMMNVFAAIYGLSMLMMLYQYPNVSMVWMSISLAYIAVYLFASFYRTLIPLR